MAIALLQSAKSGEPFHLQLKKYFSQHKKFGSKDRKTIAKLCYYFFRTGHLFSRQPTADNLHAAVFLCENKTSPFLAFLAPSLDESIHLSIEEKLAILGLEGKNIFPFTDALSPEINPENFALSFLSQPHLYLRSRPGKHEMVMSALQSQGVDTIVEGNCIQLNNAIDLSKVNGLNKNFVIQDKQSQKVFSNLPVKNIKTVWDCCAASGGKSILLVDSLKEKIQLSISDIRKNILENAKERLATAGIPIYNADIIDLTKPVSIDSARKYDLIICDVPCTGAGTWSRTPEQLYFFNKRHIANYAERQQKIVKNVIQCLNEEGLLVYITCSVFEAENEAIVKSICQNNITLLSQHYYSGYMDEADTLHVAIMRKQ